MGQGLRWPTASAKTDREQEPLMSSSRIRLNAVVALFLFLLAVSSVRLVCQNISDDEIRWGSRPYSPPSANPIHVQTNCVQVPVVVRDSKGKSVAGLKQSDFTLTDEGHPVKIASFTVENYSAAPIAAPQASQVVGATLPATPPQLGTHRRKAGDGPCAMTPYQASLVTKNFNTHSDALDLGMHL